MKIDSEDFCVRESKEVNLKKWPTEVKPYYDSKKQFKKILRERIDKLSNLQSILYAAGKDSAIKHVMSGVNPQGCQVFSFKHPSVEELDHDFYGARPSACPSVAASAFSIVGTMKRC